MKTKLPKSLYGEKWYLVIGLLGFSIGLTLNIKAIEWTGVAVLLVNAILIGVRALQEKKVSKK